MIGILAGMGPKSTAPFVDKVIHLCQDHYGATYDIDFPPMMIYSCPTPFYLDRPLNHEAMETAIIEGTRRLASTGVDFLAIPCNTAHCYFENIQKAVDIPVLNMVEEALRCVPGKRVALIATRATVEAGIYQEAFGRLGRSFVWRREWQEMISAVIAAVKSPNGLPAAIGEWKRLQEEFRGQADAVLLACTDLNVVIDQIDTDIPTVDAGHCLARAVVDRYYQNKEQSSW